MPLVAVIALYALGIALVITGLAGLLLPGLPGAPLIFAGVLAVAWADGFTRIGVGGLVATGLIAISISIIDYASSLLGARRFGASYWGMLGAFLGLLAGLAFGLPGLVLGPVVGAVVLEYVKEPDLRRAGRIGAGTFVGFVVGTAIKYALAFVMIGIALFAWWI